MRPAALSLILILAAAFVRAEILDRTVAVVGLQAIMASEIEVQIRLQAMFNDAQPDLSEEAKKAALDRLVEQRLIEDDITLAGLQNVEERDLETALDELRRGRFGGLDFQRALDQYGVKERDVREFLRKQIQFTRYVEFRFRAGLHADDETLAAEYKRRFSGSTSPPPFADVKDELREQLLAERAETMLDERVRQLRSETRIVLLNPIRPDEGVKP